MGDAGACSGNPLRLLLGWASVIPRRLCKAFFWACWALSLYLVAQLGSNPNTTLKKHGAATCLVIGTVGSFLTVGNRQLAFVVVVDLCHLEGQSAL